MRVRLYGLVTLTVLSVIFFGSKGSRVTQIIAQFSAPNLQRIDNAVFCTKMQMMLEFRPLEFHEIHE